MDTLPVCFSVSHILSSQNKVVDALSRVTGALDSPAPPMCIALASKFTDLQHLLIPLYSLQT